MQEVYVAKHCIRRWRPGGRWWGEFVKLGKTVRSWDLGGAGGFGKQSWIGGGRWQRTLRDWGCAEEGNYNFQWREACNSLLIITTRTMSRKEVVRGKYKGDRYTDIMTSYQAAFPSHVFPPAWKIKGHRMASPDGRRAPPRTTCLLHLTQDRG